jgi:hypothetical protein
MNRMRLTLALAVLTATAILAACGSDDGGGRSSTPTLAPSPTTTAATPTTSPSGEGEVSAAYLHYWDVYSDAVYNLDEIHLSEVMTGTQLARTQQEIAGLRQRGRAAKIVVEHDFFVAALDVGAGSATIHDQYTNSSYEVDAQTHAMVGDPATATMLTDTYFLVKEGEAWKVRDGARQGQ